MKGTQAAGTNTFRYRTSTIPLFFFTTTAGYVMLPDGNVANITGNSSLSTTR